MDRKAFIRALYDVRVSMLGSKHFLGTIITATPLQAQRAAAYTICCHATIESYLEWRCMEAATRHYDNYKKTSNVTTTVMSLLYYSGINLPNPPANLSKGQTYAHLGSGNREREFIAQAYHRYVKVLDDNNGIKEHNLRKMLIPIGVDMSKLDPVWLASMESFGSWRGTLSHYARTKRHIESLHPDTEYKKITDLVSGLFILDDILLAL